MREAGWIGAARLLIWLITELPIIVLNSGDPLPRHADVVLVLVLVLALGPVTPQRAAVAEALLHSMLWSTRVNEERGFRIDQKRQTTAHLTCFFPDPSTTQGEAEEVRSQAAAHGGHSVIVVTMTAHLARARTLVGPAHGWVYQDVCQTFATEKV